MSKPKAFSNSNVSVTPQIFYILIALATKSRHGYEIMKLVESHSRGRIKLGPGTLYGAIKRMLEVGLIAESGLSQNRRKYYQLTPKGRVIFNSELQRYNDALNFAKAQGLFQPSSALKTVLSYV